MSNVLVNKLRMANIIDDSQAREALGLSSKENMPLTRAIQELGYMTEKALVSVISEKFNIRSDPDAFKKIRVEVSERISLSFSQKHNVVPYKEDAESIYVATVDPFNRKVLESTRIQLRETDKRIVPVVVTYDTIIRMLGILQESQDDNEAVVPEMGIDIDLDLEEVNIASRVDSAPLVRLVDSIIVEGYRKSASDIHIEPENNITNIRFRVDGTLYVYKTLDKSLHEMICSRIKIISGLDPSNKNIPQDGSFRFKAQYVSVDLRVSVLPTVNGEKVVLRLLGAAREIDYEMSSLGLSPHVIDVLEKVIRVPNGIILVTGPTGSGKTTTLYTVLNRLSTTESSIVTVEDPVERNISGISQIQVNPKAGLTFASSLRSILRQDPDTIMIGEMRDQETAQIATRAAITGHLVLSTLHTNDAISTVSRLVDMGVEPYMISSSLKCVIAQRLVRKVCAHCKAEHINTDLEKELIKTEDEISYQGDGCSQCNFTGYTGRTAVFEILEIDRKLQAMISNKEPIEKLIEYVGSKNMITMRDEILRLVREGTTCINEAIKILYTVE